MTDLLQRARHTYDRVQGRRSRGVRARLAALEVEAHENRQLQRRVAELTDVVTELLIPIADRDEARVQELLTDYRAGL